MKRVSFFILLALMLGFFAYDGKAQGYVFFDLELRLYPLSRETFPIKDGKYRGIVKVSYEWSETDCNEFDGETESHIAHVDSTVYRYKDSITNAFESIITYRSDSPPTGWTPTRN